MFISSCRGSALGRATGSGEPSHEPERRENVLRMSCLGRKGKTLQGLEWTILLGYGVLSITRELSCSTAFIAVSGYNNLQIAAKHPA